MCLSLFFLWISSDMSFCLSDPDYLMEKVMESDSAPADTYLDDLTTKIRGELEAELEEKVSKKVQDNLSMILKKISRSEYGHRRSCCYYCKRG